jgi:hypothetical protein
MPKAPLNYSGFASVYRQFYYCKNIMEFYDYINDLDLDDTIEVLYVESYEKINMKTECIDVWYYDNYDNKLVYKSYIYIKNYDLYMSDDDKFLYFNDVYLTDKDFQEMSIERTKMIKEELVKKVYHPNNVIKYLELGYNIEDL